MCSKSLLAVLGALLLTTWTRTSSSASDIAATTKPVMSAFEAGTRIEFQGDSITDGNRGRSADPNHILGHGYQFIIAAKFGAELPERHLTFINRGVSGD